SPYVVARTRCLQARPVWIAGRYNYGPHLMAIRTFQGREAELADLAASIATSPTLIERECAFGFAATLFALRAGRPQQAQALLDRLRRDGLGAIPSSSSWLLAMLAVV